MNRPQSMSRRGFLRNVLGVSTAIFVGPGLILPEKKIIGYTVWEEVCIPDLGIQIRIAPLYEYMDRDMAMRFYANYIRHGGILLPRGVRA